MAKKSQKIAQYNIAELQPDEINQLRLTLQEYLGRKQNILNELETLKEDLKTLDEEFSSKLDIKHIKLAEKYFMLQANVTHKDTFDLFVEAMGDPTL